MSEQEKAELKSAFVAYFIKELGISEGQATDLANGASQIVNDVIIV